MYEELRRRSTGDRLRLYLDVSTLSDLASGTHPELRELLIEGVRDGRLLCPESDAVEDEVLLASAELREGVRDLADDLSLGVGFDEQRLIEWREIEAAAAAFLGKKLTE